MTGDAPRSSAGPVTPIEVLLLGGVGAILGLSLAYLPVQLFPAVAMAGLWVLAVVFVWRPQMVVMFLMVLYPIYIPLSLLVLSGTSGTVGTLISVGKDALLGLLALMTLWLGRDRLALIDRKIWISLTLLVFSIVVLAVAAPTGLRPSLLSARFHITYPLLLPVGVALFNDARLLRQQIFIVLTVAVGLALAWLSVLGWASVGELGYQMATVRLIAEQGEMGDPINVFATYLAIALCVAVGVATTARTQRGRLLLYGLSLILAWALLATFSRRAIVGAALGILVIAIIGRSLRLAVFMTVGAVAALGYASQSLIARFRRVDFGGGASERLEHVRYTLENLDPLSFFVGHGVGTAGHVAQVAGVESAVPIHNYYFLLLFEGGVLVLGLYLALCFFCVRELVRIGAPSSSDRKLQGAAVGTAGAFIAFLLGGMLGVGNAALPGAPILWATTGAVLGIAHTRPSRRT